jgi:peptidoglycan/LPS O-acetylase OafA/YrhL
MERIAALDLLRGIAALAVAVPHFIMLNAAVGWAEIVSVLAVEVFFVLSGFVLGPQILRCLHSGQASDLGVFLARRWMRTIPPYLFVPGRFDRLRISALYVRAALGAERIGLAGCRL